MLGAASQDPAQVVYHQVDHEFVRGGLEVVGISLERREHSARAGLLHGDFGLEHDATPILERQSQDAAVPLPQCRFIPALEEHSSDAQHASHGSLLNTVPVT
jgi:hypothetical protein